MTKQDLPGAVDVVTLSTRHGQIVTLANDKPISAALAAYGEWAQIEIEFLSQFVRGSAMIVDAGSHIGVHACAFADMAPGAIVHAFEPQPALHAMLVRNAAQRDRRIVVHHAALGAATATAHVPDIRSGVAMNAGAVAADLSPSACGIAVDVQALDGYGLSHVGFMKLDAEGAEPAILRGARALLERDRPVIFCEVNTVAAAADLLGAMTAHAYDAYFVATAAFNPQNFARSGENMFSHAHESALVFVPSGGPVPQKMRTTMMERVRTLDEVAALLLRVPRYGDATPHDRDPAFLAERLAEARQESAQGRTRLDAMQQRLDTLEQQNSGFMDLLRGARSENAELRNLLEGAQRQAQEQLEAARDLRGMLQRVSAELDTAHREQAATVERAASAEKGLLETRGKLEKAQAQAASATAQRRELQTVIDVTRQQSVKQKAEIDSLRGSVNALHAELDAAREAIAQAEAEIHESLAGLAGMQAQAAEADARLADLRVAHDARSAEHAHTVRLLGVSERRAEDLRKTLTAERATAKALRLEIDAARDTQAHLQQLLEMEGRRRGVVLELIESAGMPLAQRNWIGRILRRIATGSLAEAIRQMEASGLFDEGWYASSNPDAVKRLHPAVHYLLAGGYAGIRPAPDFDGEGYFEVNPDVRLSGANPLLHYAVWGRREMRRRTPLPAPPVSQVPQEPRWERPIAPPLSQFIAMREAWSGHAGVAGTPVDVIIPVYRGYDDTLACIASVLAARNETPYELVVIDDCSPEPEVSQALGFLAELGLITLLRNEANLGFVGTVNRGMALHADRDVVLLNSDTLVYHDWLDRMVAHARTGRKVATVTPFTTNGTICSYPKFCEDNREVFGLSFEAFDSMLARVNHARSVEVPTGVGFCMLIARPALDAAGLFDEETFGKGYGEENDFCMRAIAAGWKNLHALDVFVFHSGETSFGASAAESKKRGLEALQRKHPGYQKQIDAFIRRDPARAARMAADAAQLRRAGTTATTVCISHAIGGGIERYLKDLEAAALASGRDVLVLTPAAPGSLKARLHRVGSKTVPANLAAIDLLDSEDAIGPVLAALGADRLEVHSTVGWSYRLPEVIQKIARDTGIAYSVMLHDYVPLCPQVNLINESGVYCGEEGLQQCLRCVATRPSGPQSVHPDLRSPETLNVAAWRSSYGRLLAQAASVSAPSQDTADRFRRHFPELAVTAVPHAEDLSHVGPAAAPVFPGDTLRVGVIGAIGPHKGSGILLQCARDVQARRLKIEFVVVGYSNIDAELAAAGVHVTGPYEEADAGRLLRDAQLHMVFLPSVWPETFCYTLSIALAAGLPTCVFDLGAPAERLRDNPRALLLPTGIMSSPAHINASLLQFASRLGQGAGSFT